MAITVAVQGVGSGLVMPASNNAALDLLPDRAGVISGMRGVFRSTGGIIGTAVIVVILSLSEDQAAGLRMAFTVYGIVLLAAIPLTLLIPEMPRESRLGEDRRGRLGTDAARAKCRGRHRQPPLGRSARLARRPLTRREQSCRSRRDSRTREAAADYPMVSTKTSATTRQVSREGNEHHGDPVDQPGN